jgi:hypothetical protein
LGLLFYQSRQEMICRAPSAARTDGPLVRRLVRLLPVCGARRSDLTGL